MTRRTPALTWVTSAVIGVVLVIVGICIGTANVPLSDIWQTLSLHLFGHGSETTNTTIIWQIRLPRVVLAFLVGSILATAGCSYQGTFRNPLADPYLLGVSAGAGLGATTAIVLGLHDGSYALPLFAFVGALGAVMLTYTLGRSSIAGRTATSLVLAGVAISAMLTALQTLVQQRHAEKIREIYAWSLGSLATSGWADIKLAGLYIAICSVVLIKYRRVLDVFSVGDEEAQAMGLNVTRARAVVVIAASLGTAAAVSVTGLIGFVGTIVPHALRLVVGHSYRVLIPLSAILGGAFLVLADIISRTAMAPAEIPIGVITALLGAPFFLYVLGSSGTRGV